MLTEPSRPAGVFEEEWSFQGQGATDAIEFLQHSDGAGVSNHPRSGTYLKLEKVAETPEPKAMAAWLIVHHLRQADKLETISRETPAPPPDSLKVHEMLTGENAAAKVSG